MRWPASGPGCWGGSPPLLLTSRVRKLLRKCRIRFRMKRSRSKRRWARFALPTLRARALHPGPSHLRLFLVARDLVLLDHRQADVVEAVEQAVLAEGIDFELHYAAVRPANFLPLEIDRERRVGAALGIIEQLLEIVRRNLDRQNAVLETVIVENITERGRDHGTDAEIEQRPGRMLARGAAAEIVVRHENLGITIGRLVEHKVRVLAAVVVVALLGEQALAKSGALDGLQIIFRDDHIGVDIDHLQRRRDAFELGEF